MSDGKVMPATPNNSQITNANDSVAAPIGEGHVMRMPKPWRSASRLLRMSPHEIAVRLTQGARKLVDRMGSSTGPSVRWPPIPPSLDSVAPVPGLGAIDAVCEFLHQHAAEELASLLTEADAILANEVALLGFGTIQTGPVPEWHRDPISQRRSPRQHWSRVRYLDRSEVGDSKAIWELNRHQHLVRLAQAYRVSGDDRYAVRVWESIASWIRDNAPGQGINWASSLEVAFRSIAWCWIWHLAEPEKFLAEDRRIEVIAALKAHGQHVQRFLSTYFSPNTHLTGEALGLCYLATTWRKLDPGLRWWHKGEQILLRAIDEQIQGDGIHFERSSCYHLYTLDFYVHFASLYAARAEPIPAAVRTAITSLVESAMLMQRPDGLLPNVGDDDGGRLLCPVLGQPLDPAASLAAAATLLEVPAWVPHTNWTASVWLAGVPAKAFPSCNDTATHGNPQVQVLHVFSESGFVVSRGAPGDFLIASTGLQDTKQACVGHIHDDALAIELWCDGEPVFIDPGTYTYTGDEQRRSWYRSAAAHSSAIVDSIPAAPTDGPFRWRQLRRASVDRSVSGTESHLVELAATFRVNGDIVLHRRRIVAWHHVGWIIWDRFYGAGLHAVDLRYQLHGHPVRVNKPTGLSLPSSLVTVFGPADLRFEIVESAVSPRYGQLTPASALVLGTKTELPVDILTVVLRSPGDAPSAAVQGLAAKNRSELEARHLWRAVEFFDCGSRRRHWLVLQEDSARTVSLPGGPSGRFTTMWMTHPEFGLQARALLHSAEKPEGSGVDVDLDSESAVTLAGTLVFSDMTKPAR